MSATMKLTLPAVAALALLTGCAPDSGTVTERKTEVSCIGNNPPRCSPIWRVLVTDPAHRDPVYTDRPASGWTKVNEAEYGRCVLGAAYPSCRDGAR